MANNNEHIETENIKEEIKKHKRNLVLCGGGIKGIAHIGVLYALDKLQCLDKFEELTGTSVGGLIVALYALGYSPVELYEFIKLFNLGKLKNISIMNIPLFGLDVGDKFEYVIKRLIKSKGLNENITLKELYEKTKKTLILVTVCLNTMEICYLSHLTFPELPIYLAIRMSTSIPFIYCPVSYKEKLYIDGGCLDNYPISIYKDNLKETVGILLIDSKDTIDKIDNLETYILRVLQCMMIGMFINLKKGYENCTVEVHVESINFSDYDINDQKKDELFIKGYKAVMSDLDKINLFV